MRKLLLSCVLLLSLPGWVGAQSKPGAEPSLEYGAEVFQGRCVLCHGRQGLGDGLVSMSIKDYPSTNLQENHYGKTLEKLRESIIYGGSRGRMHIEMPPWGDELTYTQVESVTMFTHFLLEKPEDAYQMLERAPTTMQPSFRLGRRLFKSYCVLCHGPNGEGDGKMAKIIKNPPPFNLTKSIMPDQYLEAIIAKGGEAMGRSPRMPIWGEQFSKPEIQSVVIYIKSLRQ